MHAKSIITTAVVALVVVVAFDRFKDNRPGGLRRSA